MLMYFYEKHNLTKQTRNRKKVTLRCHKIFMAPEGQEENNHTIDHTFS